MLTGPGAGSSDQRRLTGTWRRFTGTQGWLTGTWRRSSRARPASGAAMRRSTHLRVELARRAACARSARASRAAGAAGGRLRLAGKGEVGELELGALGVGAEQLGFLSVQEGECLRAGPVRLHAHPAARAAPSAGASLHLSPRLPLGLGRNLEQPLLPP